MEGELLGLNQLQSALRLVERMSVQNQSVDVILDFKVTPQPSIMCSALIGPLY